MNTTFKRILTLLLGAAFLFGTACTTEKGGPGTETPGGTTPGGNTPGGETPGTEEPLIEDALDTAGMDDYDFTVSQLSGTDALGRAIYPAANRSNGKYVGIFYNVNNSEANVETPAIYDVEKIMDDYMSYDEWKETGGEAGGFPPGSLEGYITYNPIFDRSASNEISPNSATHWYTEPLFGYYNNGDPWVLRKHMELLGWAGVDFLLLDLSNFEFYFERSVSSILSVIDSMVEEGAKVPRAVFMLPYNGEYAEKMLAGVYSRYLRRAEYENAWFIGDSSFNPSGLPMVVGGFADMADEDRETWSGRVFLKDEQWPTMSSSELKEDALPWMDWALDGKQYNHNGIMSVSVAQHLGGTWASKAYLNPDVGASFHARGWTNGDLTTGYDPEKVAAGANFDAQWDNAIAQNTDADPENDLYMVIVTGWNEFCMRKLGLQEVPANQSPAAPFVDEFNRVYSREVEMIADDYGDNYYFQLVQRIREYRGMGNAQPVSNIKTTLDIASADPFAGVVRKYVDYVNEISARDYQTFKNVPETHYTDTTNRNDIAFVKLANDAENLYVQVTCAAEITPYSEGDQGWMNLYFATGVSGGWENYNYLVGMTEEGMKLCALTAEGGKKVIAETGTAVDYRVDGKNIYYKIPVAALGVSSAATIGVKAADNVGGELVGGTGKIFRDALFGSALDFYCYGDVAPAGRFNYAYKLA